MNGISFLFVFGKFAFPRVQCKNYIFRVVLGPFAFWVFLKDMDEWLVDLSHKLPKEEKGGV